MTRNRENLASSRKTGGPKLTPAISSEGICLAALLPMQEYPFSKFVMLHGIAQEGLGERLNAANNIEKRERDHEE